MPDDASKAFLFSYIKNEECKEIVFKSSSCCCSPPISSTFSSTPISVSLPLPPYSRKSLSSFLLNCCSRFQARSVVRSSPSSSGTMFSNQASVHLPRGDYGAAGNTTQLSSFSKMQLMDSVAVKTSANIIPINRRFTVEGRIWEPPQVKSRGDGKLRRLVDNDRISSLPGELIHCILAHLPVYDLARTSVLSKTWRNIWKMYPLLILDQQFLLKVLFKEKKGTFLSAFSAAINMILSSHTGPILVFKLFIPPKLDIRHIHLWIKHLSSKGIKTLVLYNSETSHLSSPSHLFDCSELRLSKQTSHPECFGYLTTVYLVEISISADMSFGTQLQDLYLVKCTGIEHLACQLTNSNNLKTLMICQSETVDWRWIECTKKLESFGLLLPAADFHINKSVNLISLLSNSPRINTLLLNGFTLEVSARGPSVLEGLTTKMVNLKKLSLYRLGYNMHQILACLCLIRNLPNLQDLFIGLDLEVKSINPAESTIERHLESLDWKDVFLYRLEAVQISGVDGSRSALHLIKLILASSPSLKLMSLFRSKTVCDPREQLRIKQELWLLPRKSKAAQLFWV